MLKTVWIAVKMEGFGHRVTPWYISNVDGTIVSARTARNKEDSQFSASSVFKTLEGAREDSGVHRAFCFIDASSCQHVEMIKEIHEAEGLVCPHCGPGTPLVELNEETSCKDTAGYTHYCWASEPQSTIPEHQVTLGGRKGCGNNLKLQTAGIIVCNCGSPVVDHVPGGSYCRKPL